MIFIDSGALVARYRPSDDHHQAAINGWQLLIQSRHACFTSNMVLAEAATMISRMVGGNKAAEIARSWFQSSTLTILRSTLENELAAIDLTKKYADQHVGVVDCISFALMRQHRINRIFGFDRHFQMAGFELWPSKEG